MNTTQNSITKSELMDWHRKCVRNGHYHTAAKIMSALTKVLPSQDKEGCYLLYIASYDHEEHVCGFAAYVDTTYVPHVNCKGEMSYRFSDSGSICTRLIRNN